MIPGNANPLLLASADAAAGPADTGRSLRFNTGDSAYLSRTPSSAGNRRTWTWAAWVKRNKIATGNNQEHALFVTSDSGGNSDYVTLYFNSSGYINTTAFQSGSVQWSIKTAQVFRDAGAWMHIVWAVDLSQSTASDRVKLYCNGSRITDFITETYPSSAFDTRMNSTNEHSIGRASLYNRWYASFQLADIYFVDGLQLTPTSFGSTDSNGVWQRGTYSGTFGTNGFHLLDFENESTVGHDSSGNDNDYTTNNISTSAGADNDVLFDFPANGTVTDTGAGAQINGNYCTFNPADSNQTHSNGNLEVTCAGGTSPRAGTGTIAVSSGKWYWEVTVSAISLQKGIIGVVEAAYDGNGSTIPNSNGNSVFYFGEDGNKFIDGSSSSYGASYTTNDVIGVAFNLDDDEITFYKNGTSQGTITTKTFTGAYKLAVGHGSSSGSTSYILNAGQRAFTHAAPSGFKTLNTASLPTPTIADGSDYFDTTLYTGNGANSRTISGLGFSPDFLWVKDRGNTAGDFSHRLMDAVRGAGIALSSNSTAAERDNSAQSGGGVETFTSDGFTIEQGTSNNNNQNNNNSAYVAWAWDAGSSTVSNTGGNITSNVRANQTAGFSIVGFNLSVTNTEKSIGHGLSTAPTFYIIKNRSSADNWYVYTTAVDGTLDFKYLNTTDAFQASSRTLPTSSVFYFASSTTGDHIAYCFAPVAGYSAFGKTVGNNSTDGPFVLTGFRPRFIIWRPTASGHSWMLIDTARDTYNIADATLRAHNSNAESHFDWGDILSNGFKIRNTDTNPNGVDILWAAWAENPFQANGGLAR